MKKEMDNEILQKYYYSNIELQTKMLVWGSFMMIITSIFILYFGPSEDRFRVALALVIGDFASVIICEFVSAKHYAAALDETLYGDNFPHRVFEKAEKWLSFGGGAFVVGILMVVYTATLRAW